MRSAAERLRWARERHGRYPTPTEAARAFGWTVSTYLGHENGDRNPSRQAAKRYARAYRVRWEWLLDNEGPPTIAREPSEPERISLEEFERSDPTGEPPAFPPNAIVEVDVRAGMGGGGMPSEETRVDGRHADPVKSEVWIFPESFRREELRAPANRLIVVEGQGDSMQPTIWPGERLVVDTTHRIPSPDGIYAMRDAWGAIVIKRLQTLDRGDPPRVLVISDNPAHENRERGLDEIEIVGKVIYGLKRY